MVMMVDGDSDGDEGYYDDDDDDGGDDNLQQILLQEYLMPSAMASPTLFRNITSRGIPIWRCSHYCSLPDSRNQIRFKNCSYQGVHNCEHLPVRSLWRDVTIADRCDDGYREEEGVWEVPERFLLIIVNYILLRIF